MSQVVPAATPTITSTNMDYISTPGGNKELTAAQKSTLGLMLAGGWTLDDNTLDDDCINIIKGHAVGAINKAGLVSVGTGRIGPMSGFDSPKKYLL